MNQESRVGKSVVAISLFLGLVGCGSGGDVLVAPSSRVDGGSGLNVSTGLDRETGAIIFPHQRFVFSFEEEDLLMAAMGQAMSDCVNSQGVAFAPAPPLWDPVYAASNYFGVWTVGIAERFAFVSPMTEADMRANGVTINGELVPDSTEPPAAWKSNDFSSDEALAVADECVGRPEVARFNTLEMSPGHWMGELSGTHDLAVQTEEWKDAIDEYHRCLAGKGIEPDSDDESGISVVGEDASVINAEQIALALEVVECKDRVRLVERLAGQIAAFQAPVIDEYATELVAFRDRVDVMVAEAREYLATG